MIRKCNKNDENLINNYLKDCYYKSLYLYLNYDKYKFSNSNINTYIQFDGNDNIICLLLSFGSTLHILSRDNNAVISELCDFINNNNFSVVCTNDFIANSVYNNCKSGIFDISIGKIFELKEINKELIVDKNISVEKAMESDYSDIVDLLMSDEEKKKVYSRDSLYNQLKQRNMEKYGRNYIIKDNNKVIAHAGTVAENSLIAVINSVIVNKNYRRRGLATVIVKKLCEDLLLERKICYLMVLDNEAEQLYKKIGFYEKSTYGKLIRR